jgi:endonuclease G
MSSNLSSGVKDAGGSLRASRGASGYLVIIAVTLTLVLVAGVFGVLLYRGAVTIGRANQQLRDPVAPHNSWVLRSQHFLEGMPIPIDNRYDFHPPNSAAPTPGISVLVREGFVIGHCDRFKVPLWVCAYWNRDLQQLSAALSEQERDFRPDPELPPYARGAAEYARPELKLDRGHMSRQVDNEAFGVDNVSTGNRMSNIVPQPSRLNRGLWAQLENRHHALVASGPIAEIWIVCGSVFPEMKPKLLVANDVGVPAAVYKIVAWREEGRNLRAAAFLFPQDEQDRTLEQCRTSIDQIEVLTGLNFFSDLAIEDEHEVEGVIRDLPTLPKARRN